MSERTCPLCEKDACIKGPFQGRIFQVECDTCGTYLITQIAIDDLPSGLPDKRKRAMLSAVARECSEQDSPITIHYGDSDPNEKQSTGMGFRKILETMVPHSDDERVDRALRNLHRRGPHLGDVVPVDAATDYPLLFAENPVAMRAILQYMVRSDLLDEIAGFHDGGGQYTLTVAGRARVSELLEAEGRAGDPVAETVTAASDSLSLDQRLLTALNKLDPQLGAAYSQTLTDLNDESRLTTKDCANGIRELVREVVDLVTPGDIKRGSRRDRVRAILVARGAGNRVTESAEQAASLIEEKADLFIKWYDRANENSHAASDRRELQALWRLADYLLRELLLD